MYFGRSFTNDLPFQGIDNAKAFFKEVVANAGDTFAESDGKIIWETFGLCTLTWLVVFLCIFKGVNALGKIVYFTMGIPVIALFAILIRGVTLDRASEGIFYYVGVWRGDTLSSPQIWQGAVGILTLFTPQDKSSSLSGAALVYLTLLTPQESLRLIRLTIHALKTVSRTPL
jgi:hypothetical protein